MILLCYQEKEKMETKAGSIMLSAAWPSGEVKYIERATMKRTRESLQLTNYVKLPFSGLLPDQPSPFTFNSS